MQRSRLWLAIPALLVFLVPPALAQRGDPATQYQPGEHYSRNMKLLSHIPLAGPLQVADIEIEQELSRPYVYVPIRVKDAGFFLISVKDPSKAQVLYRWTIENPELHSGHALGPAYVKTKGRYYLFLTFQFQAGSPDADLGAIVFDVTGLPDTSQIKEVRRIRMPDMIGGFHENFAYKHSSGRPLVFTTTQRPWQNIFDLDLLVAGDPNQGLIGKVPNPQPVNDPNASRGYHDSYVGFDPVTQQDRFYGAGAGGFYVYDVTDLQNPKLLTSVTGVAGMERGHTFTPTPDGRYAVGESEYQYAPLRIFDLKPGLDGTVKTVSRPIGAWTARWQGLPHNHEVRWPYVFVSAYEDGVQVFNMMDPTNPYTVGFYDTYDGPYLVGACGNGICNGPFGVDVRNADGLIVASDLTTGFWAMKMDGFDGWNGHQWGMPNVSSAQDWDNGPDGLQKKIS
ncbi:MAG: hypothetical protein HY700_07545 [Gemmatimonadetes bacterium]|nr:hypothetical protein [Gemmatimonadota bacterium]